MTDAREGMVYRHLPWRFKRQFGFVQDIPKHPSDVPEIPKEMLATVLKDPPMWFYSDWGDRCDRAWDHKHGYMALYAKVSHPQIFPRDEGSPPKPATEAAYRGGSCQRDVGHIDDHQ